MSTALQSLTLTRALGGEVYATMISCSKGDLFQRYDSNGVYPDWEATPTERPVLTYHCVSSANPSGETIPDRIEVYYDGALVTFNAGQTVSADGRFQIGGGASGQPYTVTVLKNVCTASSATTQAGHTIKIVGYVGVNTFPAMIAVDVQPRTENGMEVHIISGEDTDNPFVVDQNSGKSCRLKAQVYSGGVAVASPAGTFKWEKQTSGGWTAEGGATTDTLTVSPNDVEAYAVYRVTYTEGGVGYMDTQSVMDTGDPYYVGISVTDGKNTAEPVFAVGAQSSEKRVFTASLMARRSGASVPAWNSTWQLTRPDGTLLNSSFTGGKDTHGVSDMTQKTKTLEVPLSFMQDNGVDSMVVTAVVDFTV